MKYLFIFLLLLIHTVGTCQCFELLENKLNSLDEMPYSMVDKFVFNVKSGKSISIRVDNVKYKTKLGFIFQFKDLSDTLQVSLLTLNRKILATKKVTNDDCFLRYDPFRKSEDYFLIIKTKEQLDTDNVPAVGCLGLVIVERVKKKFFRPMQKIRWVIQKE